MILFELGFNEVCVWRSFNDGACYLQVNLGKASVVTSAVLAGVVAAAVVVVGVGVWWRGGLRRWWGGGAKKMCLRDQRVYVASSRDFFPCSLTA